MFHAPVPAFPNNLKKDSPGALNAHDSLGKREPAFCPTERRSANPRHHDEVQALSRQAGLDLSTLARAPRIVAGQGTLLSLQKEGL